MSPASYPETILAARERATPEVPVEAPRAVDCTPRLDHAAPRRHDPRTPFRSQTQRRRPRPPAPILPNVSARRAARHLAHPALLAFLRLPSEQALDLSGDIVTEDIDRILALILDSKVNYWSRSAALRALGHMRCAPELPRPTRAGERPGLFQ